MTGEPTSPAAWLSPLDSPAAYAATACMRLFGRHLPAYAALASAVALPSLAWIVRTLIAAQGEALGGTELALRFEIGAIAATGLAALVGWLQIQLLLGRLAERRLGELRLVTLLTGSVRPAHRLMAVEALVHAAIGWAAGTIMALGLAAAIAQVGGGTAPALGDVTAAAGIGLVIAVAGVLAPTLIVAIRLARLEAGPSGAVDRPHG